MNNLFNSVIFFKKVWFLLVAGWILAQVKSSVF